MTPEEKLKHLRGRLGIRWRHEDVGFENVARRLYIQVSLKGLAGTICVTPKRAELMMLPRSQILDFQAVVAALPSASNFFDRRAMYLLMRHLRES